MHMQLNRLGVLERFRSLAQSSPLSSRHQAREAEPKDYDVNVFPNLPGRNLHNATYQRFGNSTTTVSVASCRESLFRVNGVKILTYLSLAVLSVLGDRLTASCIPCEKTNYGPC